MDKKRVNSSSGARIEVHIAAKAVSRGVAIGPLICLHGQHRQFYRIELTEAKIAAELRRLKKGLSTAEKQLDRLVSNGGNAGPAIFDVHRMILADDTFRTRIETQIKEERVNAEWAVKVVIDDYVNKYKAIPDEHLRSRYIDIEDIGDRLLAALGVGASSRLRFARDSILVARELKPSTLYELNDHRPAAIITETGGWTSHTFILARELGIPAVTGAKKILRQVNTGDRAIVDGFSGGVVVNPTRETLKRFSAAVKEFRAVGRDPHQASTTPLKTLDGREIAIYVNSEHDTTFQKAMDLGVSGVGLYRSESLFNRYKGFPSEREQFEAYRRMAELAGDKILNIRLFDVGVEQLLDHNKGVEKNPALGLRAIRLALTQGKTLNTQLRSILQASSDHNIGIVLPMISDISEIEAVQNKLKRESTRLKNSGKTFGAPSLGIMIETPAAVMIIKELLEKVDFVCIGTNDLVQYLLAVDRDNESVSTWFRTLHPAVLRSLRVVIEAAAAAGKPAVVCGEMAGSPFYVPVLIGLGATRLSMNVNSIPVVASLINGIAYQEAADLIAKIDKESSSEKIEDIIYHQIETVWPHLYPPQFLHR